MSRSPHCSAASLYCAEDAGEAVSSTWISDPHSPPPDEIAVLRFIDSEHHHMPQPDRLRSVNLAARQDSINWILKVHAHYHFRPITAYLSVNYLDRFLSSHCLPPAGGWPFHLLSVVCLSLAAKMEETYVPLLIDLQLFEPRFVFESKTVQRMELWVMANLHWRLRSVTPFHYLDYLVSNVLGSTSKPNTFARLLSSSSDLILATTRGMDFLDFPPSVIATAAVLSAAGGSVDFPAGCQWLPGPFYEKLNRETVRSCHQLMMDHLIDTCPSAALKDREAEPYVAPSPLGVLDAAACVSCDTRSENAVGVVSGSGLGECEPPNKRLRSSASHVQEERL